MGGGRLCLIAFESLSSALLLLFSLITLMILMSLMIFCYCPIVRNHPRNLLTTSVGRLSMILVANFIYLSTYYSEWRLNLIILSYSMEFQYLMEFYYLMEL
jgi:hypothetical protein